MQLEFAHIRENIEACEAQIAASEAVLESMADCLGDYVPWNGHLAHKDDISRRVPGGVIRVLPDAGEVTSSQEIRESHPTSPSTPRGLLRCATDGERANGRLAWVPGAW